MARHVHNVQCQQNWSKLIVSLHLFVNNLQNVRWTFFCFVLFVVCDKDLIPVSLKRDIKKRLTAGENLRCVALHIKQKFVH